MHRCVMGVLLSALGLFPSIGYAQSLEAQERTEQIVSQFNKAKHEFRDVLGVRKERYKEIRSVPAVLSRVAEYGGRYQVPRSGDSLQLYVGPEGKLQGSGWEQSTAGERRLRRYTLMDAQIRGALLTATKRYSDGTSEVFEGVFIHMTDLEGASPSRVEQVANTFGLGVIAAGIRENGMHFDKLFYARKE